MLQIPDSLIVNYSMSPEVYKKGTEYYRKGRIKSLGINENKNRINSVVKGTQEYKVGIDFDDRGVFREAACSCPSSSQYWGHCEHVVAVLLHLKWLKENDGFHNVIARKSAREMFDLFQHTFPVVKTPVKLEAIYEYKAGGNIVFGTTSLLSIKIGIDKLYMIKSIPRFFKQLEDNEVVEFGKDFVFDPYWHQFAKEDQLLINFLQEVYEISKHNSYLYGATSSIFKNKYLLLTPALIKRFFALMNGRGFSAVINDNQYDDMKVLNEDIPVTFDLDSVQEDFVLDINFEDIIYPITSDNEYLLKGDKIYRPSSEQVRYLAPFIRLMNKAGNRKLIFLKEDRERFVSEILPYAQRVGKVNITEHVSNMIVKGELVTEVYFDREDKGITARVKFIYGNREVHPFGPGKNQVTVGEKILLRDIESERQVLDLFEQYAFIVRPNSVYLKDENKIYDFFYTGLDILSLQATIYYSEDFKIAIRQRVSYSAGIRLNSQSDLLDFDFNIEGVDPNELSGIFAALREKKRYYRLKDGSFMPLDSDKLYGLSQLIDHLGINGKDLEQQTYQMPKYRALYLEQQLKDAGIVDVDKSHNFVELVRNILNPGELDIAIPEKLKHILRDYQCVGFKWLKTLAHYGMGGILADDMGLGKTLEILALLLSEKDQGRGPSLVVAPTSLVYNWEAEVQKFVPELSTLVVAGTKDERRELMKSIPNYDLVVTSYPLIRRDREEYDEYDFKYCIIDEAQHIKNPSSKGARAVKSIRAQTRFALTGTPMENSLTELWSIFDFVMSGYLFRHSKFITKYEKPIVNQQDILAMEDLSRHIKPFILRRLKVDVLKELPEKIENKVIAELTDDQKKIYLAYLAKVRGELAEEIDRTGFEKNQIMILSALTRLRQISCHPGMFLDDYHGDSGKLQLLEEIVRDALDGGHRILIFSQFTSMLKIIRERLDIMKIKSLYLDGSTNALERRRLVNVYNEGEGDIFLISLKAGGTGLNLTGADTVIHFDPWWNPAVEDQASDRAYRIGQKRVVHVMRLITKGTIEEKIESLKQKKKDLTDAVIKPGESFVSCMSKDEVMALFD